MVSRGIPVESISQVTDVSLEERPTVDQSPGRPVKLGHDTQEITAYTGYAKITVVLTILMLMPPSNRGGEAETSSTA